MSIRRFFKDNAPTATLAGPISSSATAVTISSAAGFPTNFPYTATIDIGTSSAEQVLVTSAVGTSLTITRDFNGQGSFSHPVGANFNHTSTSVDFDEANSHVNATTNVHGVTGTFADTNSAQTLANKTLTASTLTSPAFTGAATGLVASSPNDSVSNLIVKKRSSTQSASLWIVQDQTGTDNYVTVEAGGKLNANKGLVVVAVDPTSVGVKITAAPSPANDIFRIQDNTNNSKLAVLSTGDVAISTNATARTVTATATAVADNPLVAKGMAGQTGDLIVGKDSTGTAKFRVGPAGDITTAGGATVTGALTVSGLVTNKMVPLDIANLAARTALGTPATDQLIWRADMKWFEVYDGTKWRVRGTAQVANVAGLSNVTDPVDGQIAITLDTHSVYQYITSAWTQILAPGTHLPVGVETGQQSVSFSSVSFSTQSVTFVTPFTSAPKVMTDIESAPAATAGWISRAIGVTNTGFTLYVASATGTNGTWSNIPVDWIAIGV